MPQTFVPKSIKMPRFDYFAMPDIDFWVKSRASRFLFVYGSNDPWGAEPFELGWGTKDSYRYYVAGGNHGSKIAQLPAAQAAEATATVRRWAGLPVSEARAFTPQTAPAGFPDFDTDLTLTGRPRL